MTRQPPHSEVLIVGAGPVGLSLACELYRHGVSCRIIDRRERPSDDSKAFVIHSRTLEILEHMGCLAPVLAEGLRVPILNIYDRERRLVRFDFGVLDGPFPFIISLPQSRLERVLEHQLESLGGHVERQTALASLVPGERDVGVGLEAPSGERADARVAWVIGCDGARSTVRGLIGEQLVGSTYDREFIIADGWLEGIEPITEAHTFVSAGGYVMVFPLPGGLQRVVVDCPNDYCIPAVSLDHLHRRLRERGLERALMRRSIWLSNTTFHRRIVGTFRHGAVLLAGDAAHIHSPLGGQGMNTGIQDAHNLGWKLALVLRGQAHESLIDSYATERRRAAVSVLEHTDAQTRTLLTASPVRIAIRNALARAVTNHPAVQRKLSHQASGLALRYRAGNAIQGEPRFPVAALSFVVVCAAAVIAGMRAGNVWGSVWALLIGGLIVAGVGRLRSGGFRSGPAPGERAPDVVLEDGSRLSSRLRDRRTVLLLFSAGDADAARRQRDAFGGVAASALRILQVRNTDDASSAEGDDVVVDRRGAVQQRYHAVPGAGFLIRPDGYVALRRRRLVPADVVGCLERMGIAGQDLGSRSGTELIGSEFSSTVSK